MRWAFAEYLALSERIPARDWEKGVAAAAAGGTGKIILDWTEL